LNSVANINTIKKKSAVIFAIIDRDFRI